MRLGGGTHPQTLANNTGCAGREGGGPTGAAGAPSGSRSHGGEVHAVHVRMQVPGPPGPGAVVRTSVGPADQVSAGPAGSAASGQASGKASGQSTGVRGGRHATASRLAPPRLPGLRPAAAARAEPGPPAGWLAAWLVAWRAAVGSHAARDEPRHCSPRPGAGPGPGPLPVRPGWRWAARRGLGGLGSSQRQLAAAGGDRHTAAPRNAAPPLTERSHGGARRGRGHARGAPRGPAGARSRRAGGPRLGSPRLRSRGAGAGGASGEGGHSRAAVSPQPRRAAPFLPRHRLAAPSYHPFVLAVLPPPPSPAGMRGSSLAPHGPPSE